MKTLSVMFAVQGEGRGHLTQAISMYELLTRNGFEVCCVVVGGSSRRELPEFFKKSFNEPVVPMKSPNFFMDRHGRGIHMGRTLIKNLLMLPEYIRSVRLFKRLVDFHEPDLILNFYEPLVGLYAGSYSGHPPVVCIAHQYSYLHPEHRFPISKSLQKIGILAYTKLTKLGSNSCLAISLSDSGSCPRKKLYTVPPILRRELLSLHSRDEGYLLVYLVNSGYMKDILEWHRENPEVHLRCFTDSREVREEHFGHWQVDAKLSFHSLDGTVFLEQLAGCSGLATTAGFETVCEAMFLGKPIFMVPVKGHFEQRCNAVEAQEAGAGLQGSTFDMNQLINITRSGHHIPDQYRDWVLSCPDRLLSFLHGFLLKPHTVEAPYLFQEAV